MPRYNPAVIEPKWQRYWEDNRTFAAARHTSAIVMEILFMMSSGPSWATAEIVIPASLLAEILPPPTIL